MANIPELFYATGWHTELAVNRSVIKAAFDRLGALFGLAMLAPFLILVAILIKLDSPGPVFFTQKRTGLHGRVFTILKFRTMTAESSRAAFIQAKSNDMRVTRIGRFLRKTSIDELPQLLNVLRGDMSLIGPRPHPLPLDDAYRDKVPNFMSRYGAKPGLTGLAQVNGHRGETPDTHAMAMRVAYDIEYIRRWSLWMDMTIVLRSAVVVFRGA